MENWAIWPKILICPLILAQPGEFGNLSMDKIPLWHP